MSINRSVLSLSFAALLTGLMASQAFAGTSVNTSRSNIKNNLTTDDLPAADLLLSTGPITYPSAAVKDRGIQLNISGGRAADAAPRRHLGRRFVLRHHLPPRS